MSGHPRWRRQRLAEPADGEIHVWRIRLDARATDTSLLSADEQTRARRLRDATRCAQFVAGRTALRRLLGAYTGTRPQALEFAYGPHGKPALPDRGPAFNFTHSEDLALLAVASDRAVGIDIEHRNRTIHAALLARHILTRQEATAFRQVPPTRQTAALLATWTRKEAYIKALGDGFSRPLRSFSVAVPADSQPARLKLDDQAGSPQRWTFMPLDPHPDYLAALAAPGTDWTLHCFDWQSGP
jgi:4'-phosphopantetheinyl transferase